MWHSAPLHVLKSILSDFHQSLIEHAIHYVDLWLMMSNFDSSQVIDLIRYLFETYSMDKN